MGNGNPALAGTPPTDPNATAGQIANSGPNGKQPGINATTNGDNHATASSHHEEAGALKWYEVKGSKIEYVWGGRFDIVLGVKHTIIGGMKTGIDLAYNRTYNLDSYRTFFGGARYEIITPKKTEKVFGKKDDDAKLPKKERVNGAWTHTSAAKEKKNQALLKVIVEELMEQAGSTLNKIITKYEAKWDKVSKHADSVKQKSQTVREKIMHLNVAIKDYKVDIKTISDICKEFERKAAQMEIAADSALEIKAAKSSIKGGIVGMKAGTLKLTANLVKLGE